MTAAVFSTCVAAEAAPRASMPAAEPSSCQTALMTRVGAALAQFSRTELSDDELEIHIEDANHLFLTAYERFQLHGNHEDRSEAMEHLRSRDQAILARSVSAQMERHAAFERQISEGVDYFQSRGAADRASQLRRHD